MDTPKKDSGDTTLPLVSRTRPGSGWAGEACDAGNPLGLGLAERGLCFQLLGLFLSNELTGWIQVSQCHPNKQDV